MLSVQKSLIPGHRRERGSAPRAVRPAIDGAPQDGELGMAGPLPESLIKVQIKVRHIDSFPGARYPPPQETETHILFPRIQPPLSSLFVFFQKPLGLVLAEKGKGGAVFVEDVVAGGNADVSGKVQKGDLLIRCSATVLKSDGLSGSFEAEGYGQRPYTNWNRIMFDCRDKDFATVMSALGSNNERWGIFDVYLEFQRPT